MPFPHEHAARLTDPNQYDEFRRENNKFADGVHAIWGIKGKGDDRKSELQAIRFDSKKFTVDEAKKWLKDHDFKYTLFEPASEEGKSYRDKSLEKYETKTFVFDIKQDTEPKENRTLVALASTGHLDRDGDMMMAEGWKLENYLKNPVVLFAHDWGKPPVAKTVDIQTTGGVLRFKAQFPTKEEYEFADTVYQLYKGGYLRSFSVGFRLMRWEDVRGEEGTYRGKKIMEQELIEISAVPIPTNPFALVEAVQKGLNPGKEFFCTGCAYPSCMKTPSQTPEIQSWSNVLDWITKEGRILSDMNETDIAQAIQILEDLLKRSRNSRKPKEERSLRNEKGEEIDSLLFRVADKCREVF